MTKPFAGAGDMQEKTPRLTKIGPDPSAHAAPGDRFSAVIAGVDAARVIAARAASRLAGSVPQCLPFDVACAFGEARDIDIPRIRAAQRDARLWGALQR
jgi:hypothetical protein